MQHLLIILVIVFLIIIAPALLIALAAPERLGMILGIWTAGVAIAGVLIWFRFRSRIPEITARSSQFRKS